ncbi:Membrane protein implicated in regulation of membrane protease activity [Raineyella antarctica]|uniref:Membrane protein implicated in regulation of membrane protease activity n=1 Tax=Raineyella antarctica TaxID=1577474 RepID=A0A1G6GP93_9ACTN|nr:NfeD family protein [Raineyella antarctica]SDB83585.1 Membrane protein implicated in regulation of membrane protease activity [Raineyella antarctica]
MQWFLWLIVAAVLGAAEIFTLTLALGLLAAAALVAAVVAGLGGSLLAQILAFSVSGALGLLVVRPIARRQLNTPPLSREGTDALIGRSAVVLKEVTADQGLVKLAGDEWSARSFDESQVIPVGTTVEVMEIDGARAVVYPRELLP